MKQITSTLEGYAHFYTRRSGNTTRQIDAAINSLFNGNIVKVEDHFQRGQNKNCNQDLFRRILKRLDSEHDLSGLVAENKIKIDRVKLTLELL